MYHGVLELMLTWAKRGVYGVGDTPPAVSGVVVGSAPDTATLVAVQQPLCES